MEAESTPKPLGGVGIGWAVCWAVLGTTAPVTVFATSLSPHWIRSIPFPLYLAVPVLVIAALPTCAAIPIPLLISGYRRVRKLTGAGSRWVITWLVVGSVCVGIEALFLCSLLLLFLAPTPDYFTLSTPSWSALGYALGYLVTGIVMAVVLISARRSRSRIGAENSIRAGQAT